MPVRSANIPKQGFGGIGPSVSVKVAVGVSAEDADRILANQNGVSVADLYQPRWDFLDTVLDGTDNMYSNSSYGLGCISNITWGMIKVFALLAIAAVAVNIINSLSEKNKPSNAIEKTRTVQPDEAKSRSVSSKPIKKAKPMENQMLTEKVQSKCQIWAAANPSLASRLKNGDHCYGEF